MKTPFLFALFTVGIAAISQAQSFLNPFESFSTSKISYFTLTNGQTLEGKLKSVKRKKGVILAVKFKTEANQTYKLKANEIQEMYVMPTGLERFAVAVDDVTNIKKAKKGINSDHIDKGYGYFVQTKTTMGKGEEILLLQMLNPHFPGEISVFHDPRANETMRVGVGGMTMAGGDDKSYYIKVGNSVAKKIKKKDYEKEYTTIYKSCPNIAKRDKKDIKWKSLAEDVHRCNTANIDN
jgi:hypothetical protein